MATQEQRDALRGPLSVRWHTVALGVVRAGTLGRARVELENTGSATWRWLGEEGVRLGYHWLDDLGNPIVWDGVSTPLERPVAPGEAIDVEVAVRAPMPPARYRLAFDLLDAERVWFSDVGNAMLTVDVDVEPRIARRSLAVEFRPGLRELEVETRAALAAQEEPLAADRDGADAVAYLVPGCMPAPDWSRRVLDAHAEGYAAVGGSIEPIGGFLARRRAATALAAWAPGGGRNPSFDRPLLCPSVLAGVEPTWADDVADLPALLPPDDEPSLYDGRIAIRVRLRSDRRRG